jgi:hypothetical protein
MNEEVVMPPIFETGLACIAPPVLILVLCTAGAVFLFELDRRLRRN